MIIQRMSPLRTSVVVNITDIYIGRLILISTASGALVISTASGALVVGGVRDISHPSIPGDSFVCSME